MLVLVVVASIHLFIALKRINNFTGGDETLWSYQRVPDFWNAVATQNWKKTNISDTANSPNNVKPLIPRSCLRL